MFLTYHVIENLQNITILAYTYLNVVVNNITVKCPQFGQKVSRILGNFLMLLRN